MTDHLRTALGERKKDELTGIARKFGVAHSGLTKAQLMDAILAVPEEKVRRELGLDRRHKLWRRIVPWSSVVGLILGVVFYLFPRSPVIPQVQNPVANNNLPGLVRELQRQSAANQSTLLRTIDTLERVRATALVQGDGRMTAVVSDLESMIAHLEAVSPDLEQESQKILIAKATAANAKGEHALAIQLVASIDAESLERRMRDALHTVLGNSAYGQERFAKAVEYFKRVPGPESAMMLSSSYIGLAKLPLAEEALDSGISEGPAPSERAGLLVQRAYVRSRRDNLLAIVDYQDAIKLLRNQMQDGPSKRVKRELASALTGYAAFVQYYRSKHQWAIVPPMLLEGAKFATEAAQLWSEISDTDASWVIAFHEAGSYYNRGLCERELAHLGYAGNAKESFTLAMSKYSDVPAPRVSQWVVQLELTRAAVYASEMSVGLQDPSAVSVCERARKEIVQLLAFRELREVATEDQLITWEVESCRMWSKQAHAHGYRHEPKKALQALENAYAGLVGLEKKTTDETRLQHRARLTPVVWQLATALLEDHAEGAADRALSLAQKAAELTDWKHPEVLRTLASAHANLGEFDAAVKVQQALIELLGDDVDASEQDRMESYRKASTKTG